MPKPKLKPIVWTLADAVELVQVLEPSVRAAGYHTLLGGGVLHAGFSRKDLDLFFLPLNTKMSNPARMLGLLTDLLDSESEPLRNPLYPNAEEWHFETSVKFSHGGKRIDVFIQ